MRFEGEVLDECFDRESTANLWAINWFIYEEHNFTGSYRVIETFFFLFLLRDKFIGKAPRAATHE